MGQDRQTGRIQDAVEPALPGRTHRPLEGGARSAAGVVLFQRGARRIAPSRRITSPLSISFSMMCLASLA